MEAFVGPIVDGGSRLWENVANLKENLEFLEVAMERLKQVYEDVKERVEREEQLLRKRKRTNEVAGWLDRVQRKEAQVIEILQEGKEQEHKKYDMLSRYNVGKRVSKMVNEVNELRTEGAFNVVAMDVVRAIWINEKPVEKTVGLELMVEEVWRCIEDTDLQTIGLYGLGGVGKTTLLKQINNEFLNRSHGFDAVIWVSVSKQPDLKKMQEAILREFQIHRGGTGVMLPTLFHILRQKKFVLLLDDIWERLDLAELGVPIQNMHQNGSKVVFTTRSLEICGLMEAQRKIKVECLTPEAALDLFRKKVGQDTLNSHPRISKLAEIMVAECKGLPLALVTVGRSMASRMKPEEWEQAISILRNSPSQFPGMLNDVLLLLKFSFDRLQNTTLKSCFLYCCVFPEDYIIRKEEIIELWLGEGLLDEFVDCYVDEFVGLSNVRKKGEYIIGGLKQTCLLESGESEEFVTMHQMVRDMALWECREKIKIYVRRGPRSIQAYGSGGWNETERISLWDHDIEDLPINDSQLLNLRTLIYKAPMLISFPVGIFSLMPTLTILDLSSSILLRVVPVEIGKLINLQYLNLSETNISQLPTELRNLTKLRCLLLDCTRLQIQKEMISNFQLLEVFSIRLCDEYGKRLCDEYGMRLRDEFAMRLREDDLLDGWEHRLCEDFLLDGREHRLCEDILLDELEHLQHISEISIVLSTALLERLLRSPKLLQCLKKLCLYGSNSSSELSLLLSLTESPSFSIEVSPSLLRRMEHLELNSQDLKISLETGFVRHHYFENLCRVVITGCRMSDVTWLIYAPRLQHLTLTSSTCMKEVIGDTSRVAEIEENAGLFSSLIALHLEGLQWLKSICRHALPFPFLVKIKVQRCPNLKKLPFDSNSAKNNLKQIYGTRRWWDGLQWEDEAIKQVFTSKFLENPYD